MLLQQQVPSTGDVYQKIYPAIIATKILSVEPHAFRGFQVLDLVREVGSQALYPELWDDVELTENYDPARSTRPTEAVKYETSRFLHINQYPSAGSPGTLYNEEFGSDNMTANTFGPGGNGRTKTSNALFIDWDESQRDNYIEVYSIQLWFCSTN